MSIRRFGKIRRFNKKIQIWFYHLKQNKFKLAMYVGFILLCLNGANGGNPKSVEQAPPINTDFEPTWRSYLISLIIGQIIFYLIHYYSGYPAQVPQVEVKKRFVLF